MCTVTAAVDTADWTVYASYSKATKAVKKGSTVYVLANGNLFSYDESDSSVETYTKANALSDVGIFDIALSTSANTLVVVYESGNVDLLVSKEDVWNMPELKLKALNDKTINELVTCGNKAYISTGSGLSVVNLDKKTFENFYAFPQGVSNSAVRDGRLYAKTPLGIYCGNMATNLLDPINWELLTSDPDISFGPTAQELAASAKLLETAKSFTPNSPKENYAWHLNLYGDKLLVSGGVFLYDGTPDRRVTAMIMENGKWSALNDEEVEAKALPMAYLNATDFLQDPADAQHYWVGTARSGIYEFQGGKFVGQFTAGNSPLETILPQSSHAYMYVRVTGLNFDKDGNLWMCNNQVKNIVNIFTKERKWLSWYIPEVNYYTTFDHIFFDQRGWAWINSRRTAGAREDTHGVAPNAGVLIYNTNGTLEDTKDDTHKFISTFYNQDGAKYVPNEFRVVAEDLDGNMWFGCNQGLFMTDEPSNVFNSDFILQQIKITREDNPDLANYLLSEVNITAIAIDGANRKWIGTESEGVYLISADGQEMIQHFVSESSPLLSNSITDIKINGTTGEVFFATSNGLCSFIGDATTAEETLSKNNIKVYPNPVRPEDRSLVRVTGLAMSTDVKIADAAGRLVYQGTSNGGEFTWRCVHSDGKAVSPGVYYILATDSEGKKGASAKVVIIR